MNTFDLSAVDGLGSAMFEAGRPTDPYGATKRIPGAFSNGHLYCACCQREQRVQAQVRYTAGEAINPPELLEGEGQRPKFLEAHCVHCRSKFSIVVCDGPLGVEVIVLPQVGGGLATENTPGAVSYYLDQAHRAEAMSASSAAVAMYRAALEQLLFHEGFTKGMLNEKIKAAAETPPKWWDMLDQAFLDVIKDLGNGAIHTNGGDISKQAALDTDTLAGIRSTFVQIIEVIYERPARDAKTLAALQAAAAAVKK